MSAVGFNIYSTDAYYKDLGGANEQIGILQDRNQSRCRTVTICATACCPFASLCIAIIYCVKCDCCFDEACMGEEYARLFNACKLPPQTKSDLFLAIFNSDNIAAGCCEKESYLHLTAPERELMKELSQNGVSVGHEAVQYIKA